MADPIKDADAEILVKNLEKLATLAAGQPAFKQAASALPGFFRAGVSRLRTPKGPLPGSPLTESPKSYSDRAISAPGSAPYFDRYNKQRPASVPDDATIAALPATAVDQKGSVGAAVKSNPTVVVRNGSGTPIEGVEVRFAINLGQSTIGSAAALTDGSGQASAGAWTLKSPGSHSLQALAGPLTLRFTATAG
jgi:hypothetical protein